jgi:hypothetical protein
MQRLNTSTIRRILHSDENSRRRRLIRKLVTIGRLKIGDSMRTTAALLTFLTACLPLAQAHETNAPRTRMQEIETRTNTVIVRGFVEIGAVECGRSAVVVMARESTDKATGEKVLGLAVTLRIKDRIEVANVIDHDEMESLVRALDQLLSPQWNDTSMPQVEVMYTTRDGLRIASFSNRAATAVEAVLQTTYPVQTTTILNSSHLVAFRNLIDQARGRLDAIARPKQQ